MMMDIFILFTYMNISIIIVISGSIIIYVQM